MHSAKPDKPLFAATDLEMPAGVRFRQAEVWAGLEASLQKRRRMVFIGRLSVAAALLLALAVYWWMAPHTTGKQPTVAKQQEPAPALPTYTPVEKQANQLSAETTATPPVELRKSIQHHEPSETLSQRSSPSLGISEDAPKPSGTLRNLPEPSIAQAPVDSAHNTEAVAASPAPPPAKRQYRIAHLNDNTTPAPFVADAPAEDRQSFLHIPLTGASGPNAGSSEIVERKPRTLMSLFKPHQ